MLYYGVEMSGMSFSIPLPSVFNGLFQFLFLLPHLASLVPIPFPVPLVISIPFLGECRTISSVSKTAAVRS